MVKNVSKINIMEVCGTHTEVISKYGIRKLYSDKVRLISGPGCPICVIPTKEIDRIIAYLEKGFIIATFGDLIRILKLNKGLDKISYKNLQIVYSPLDALKLAKSNPKKQVIFIGLGFETTAPLVARTIIYAHKKAISNFSVYCLHKTMPAILKLLLSTNSKIDAFLLPGHVCTITGSKPFGFIAKEFGKTCVISGFEPEDIIESINIILENINRTSITVQYKRAVKENGNTTAKKVLNKVFKPSDSKWQGFGIVKNSGLEIREKWQKYDANKRWRYILPKKLGNHLSNSNESYCNDVLRGIISPIECPFFKAKCTPQKPIGSCMVSSEGACRSYYEYRRDLDV